MSSTTRVGYVRGDPSDLALGLIFVAWMEDQCPTHWAPLTGHHVSWCGGLPGEFDCGFEFANRMGHVRSWAWTRYYALIRDGGRCQADGCTNGADEVDHIVEIQDGGAEFDLSNVRSLCHECHVTKTVARRRYGPQAAERVLLERNHPELLPPLEAFL